MNIADFDTNKKVFVIAEIGNNHEGDIVVAKELVTSAAEAGVDAVKFQTYIPEHIYGGDSNRLERLRKFRLKDEEFSELADYAKAQDVIFFSTPFDIATAKFLNSIQPIFKIASSDNNFFPLIDSIAHLMKPMLVSTGGANISLIDRIEKKIKIIWKNANVDPGLAFLHCVSSYPTPRKQVNLAAIPTLVRRYPGATIGYSDHTLGINAVLYAVSAGARIVEKHFTLDRNYSSFRDHSLSADPEELAEMVSRIREISDFLGTGEKEPQPCEAESFPLIRRSVAAVTDLPVGHVLQPCDLTWVRPGTGIPVGEEGQILDRTLIKSLNKWELISLDDVK